MASLDFSTAQNHLAGDATTDERIHFMSGYIAGYLQDCHQQSGETESGLYKHYVQRYAQLKCGLLPYECALIRHIARMVAPGRRMLHPGNGLGTTAVTLYTLGHDITGVEADRRRIAAASRLKGRIETLFAVGRGRFDTVEGYFPNALATGLAGRAFDILLFTNFNTGLPEAIQSTILARFADFGEVILDLRQFGQARETRTERDALRKRIEATRPKDIRAIAVAGAGVPAATDFIHVYY